MARLIGIGGLFLFADDTERLAQWYRTHLGLGLVRMDEAGVRPTFYVELFHRDLDEVEVRRHIVFAIMPADGTLTTPRNQAMVNYRVDDLDVFVEALTAAGVECERPHEAPDAEGVGRFAHLRDPEGNRIELWQHIEAEPEDRPGGR